MKWFKSLWSDFKTYRLNKKNFKQFVKDVQNEMSQEDSVLKSYGISLSDDRHKLSMLVTLPGQIAQYPDERIITAKLNEFLAPISKFLCFDMNWLEFLSYHQTYHIEDEQTEGMGEGKPFSLTYLAMWEFRELEYDKPSRKKLFDWLIYIACTFTGLVIAGTWMLLKTFWI